VQNKLIIKFIFFSFLISICSNTLYAYTDSIKIGLGSCLDQNYPQPIWQTIEKENLNYFVFLGDNVYGDSPTGSLIKMKRAYKKQKKMFPDFLNEMKIYSIWDDHDYGINDGGADYKNKRKAQELFLDFWKIPKQDIRTNRDGIYFAREETFFDKKFKFIFLDTRFFRSKLLGSKGSYNQNLDLNATILGEKQWKWVESELKTNFDFLIIFSSIQIIAEGHKFEKWNNFPKEKSRLLNLISDYKDKTILFSGDRHRAGIYQQNKLFEVTTSSMNKPGSSFFETDYYLIGETYPQENFAVLEIFENNLTVKIKDIKGNSLNSVKFEY
jgi:alkaline phosphatase D